VPVTRESGPSTASLAEATSNMPEKHPFGMRELGDLSARVELAVAVAMQLRHRAAWR
jgi:hypothetical protein